MLFTAAVALADSNRKEVFCIIRPEGYSRLRAAQRRAEDWPLRRDGVSFLPVAVGGKWSVSMSEAYAAGNPNRAVLTLPAPAHRRIMDRKTGSPCAVSSCPVPATPFVRMAFGPALHGWRIPIAAGRRRAVVARRLAQAFPARAESMMGVGVRGRRFSSRIAPGLGPFMKGQLRAVAAAGGEE